MIVLAVVLSLAYWVVSAGFNALFLPGVGFWGEVFSPGIPTTAVRLGGIAFLIALGVYCRFVLLKRQNGRNKPSEPCHLTSSVGDPANAPVVDRLEEEIRQKCLNQAVLNSLLRFSLENISLDGFLKCALNTILAAPSLSSSMGAIFLADNQPGIIYLKAQNNLPRTLQRQFREIKFGEGPCGEAAATGQVRFAGAHSDPGRVRPSQTKKYGHYCVPILYGSSVLGVIDIYSEGVQKQNMQQQEFLIAAANTLAGVIQRKKFEERLSRTNACFANLGVNPADNIQKLVELCGDILGATAVSYNRFDPVDSVFYPVGCFGCNLSRSERFKASGSICYHLIKKEQVDPFIVYDFPKTSYAKTDNFYLNCHFQTYTGQIVKCRQSYAGVLSVMFKDDHTLREEDKRFLSIIALAVGIEEERASASQELEEAYSKLKEAQQELVQSEKLAALGRFSSGVAHEVKNPLGVILGGIEFLEKKISPGDAVVETAIKKIKESTLRADAIVRNLLKFAMPSEAKKVILKPRQLITDTLALLKYRVSLTNIDIKTDFSKADIYIEVDKNQLGQVIFNLLINAIEAIHKKGKIKIKTHKTIREDFSKTRPVCVMEITDNGEGVSRENLSKLFEPFFTTKRDKRGTGLGLSMSKMIVENHKGSLTIESESGKGTTVRIILPVVEMQSSRPAVEP